MTEYDMLKAQKDVIVSQEETIYFNELEMRLRSGPYILTDADIAATMAAIKAMHAEKRKRAGVNGDAGT